MAADANASFEPESALHNIKQLEIGLTETGSKRKLESAIADITKDYQSATQCISEQESALKALEEPLAIVGEEAEGDSVEIIQQRRILQKQKSDVQNALSACRLLALEANRVSKAFSTALQQQRAEELFTARLPTWELVLQLRPWTEWRFDFSRFAASSGWHLLEQANHVVALFLVFISLIIGFWLKRTLRPTIESEPPTFVDTLSAALVAALRYHAIPLVFFVTMSLYMHYLSRALEYIPFVASFCYGGLVFVTILTVQRMMLIPGVQGAQPLVSLPLEQTHSISQRLTWLTTLLFACFLVYMASLTQALSISVLALSQDILLFIFVSILWWLVWLVGRITSLRNRTQFLRLGVLLFLASVVVIEIFSYRSLAEYLLINFLKTAGLALSFWLLNNLLKDTYQGFFEGTKSWQIALRENLGLEESKGFKSFYWFYLLASAALWVLATVLLLRIWGVSDASFHAFYLMLLNGFEVGEYKFVPVQTIVAILMFVALFIIFKWFNEKIVDRALYRTNVERGSREAIVSIMGYVGFTIALIIALVVAGVDFASLAIIAGALSVGIGFGLQNVVSNFVSGIILLFERPIKRGDWIVVGESEGYVKKISIRSTVIQTFDRSDVIVPNSDLVSNQVTNWMLREHFGRIRINIGVAYGSDTKLVRNAILEVVNAHPDIITSGIVPKPSVLFLSFGDSALEFEIRAMIFDIDNKWNVISDLHFGIDQAFRKAGVEIPFPQRDLHIRNWPESGKPSELDGSNDSNNSADT